MVESAGAPGSQASLREANSARILDAVRLYGQITQVELAGATGLSPATVSNIVRQLQSQGVVATEATTRSGRRAQLVTLARSSGLAAGVHIGRRALEVRVTDASLAEVARQHLPLPAEHRYDTTLDRVAMLVAELVEDVGATIDDVVGLGVALPADVERTRGVAGALAGWQDVDVADVLGRRLGRPVVTVQEAEAAAVAESRSGALRGAGCALYVRVGETTDSALLVGGAVHRGRSGAAAGVGHVRVAPAGAICRCGARGCLNTVVSADALGELLRISHGPIQLRDIVTAVNRGDRGCQQAVGDAGAAIGSAIADVATLLAPDRIAVGGPLAETGEVLLAPIRDALRARPLVEDPARTLVAGQLGASAEALGVAALVFGATDPLGEG